MDIDTNVKGIELTHWIDVKTENKRWPIIVQFAGYSERHRVCNSKKRLNVRKFPSLRACQS